MYSGTGLSLSLGVEGEGLWESSECLFASRTAPTTVYNFPTLKQTFCNFYTHWYFFLLLKGLKERVQIFHAGIKLEYNFVCFFPLCSSSSLSMDFCFALIWLGTCEAHLSPELYWKIPLWAVNSGRIDRSLFLSSYLQGLGVTDMGWEWGQMCHCAPQEGGWHRTLRGNRPRQAIMTLESCSEEMAGASSLVSSRCGVSGHSSNKLFLWSPTLKYPLLLMLTFPNSSAKRQLIPFSGVFYRRPVGNFSCHSWAFTNLGGHLLCFKI